MDKMDSEEFKEYRYEKKFVIRELEDYEIEKIIKQHPVAFSEIFYKRRVNNIYFDSMDMDYYNDNLSGTSDRLKIRIRWYGRLFGEIKPLLELKIKRNELGRKISFPLKPFKFDREFSLEFFKKVLDKSDIQKWIVEEFKTHYPSLLNCYDRKYFISADKKYRATIDTNMKFFRIKNRNNLFLERINEKNTKILELKYAGKDYKKAEHITQHLPFRVSRSSKYISGINVLELV